MKDTIDAFLELEMEEHLGYPKHDVEGRNIGNSRNGAKNKTVRGDFGEVEIETQRDRNASFEPKLVAKRQRSVGNFSEAIVSLYTRGLSTREIEQHVKEIYGIDISPQFVPRVTKELQQQIAEWQNRLLRSRLSGCFHRRPARLGSHRRRRPQKVRLHGAGPVD